MKRIIISLYVSTILLLGIIFFYRNYGKVYLAHWIRTLAYTHTPQSTDSISVKSRIWKISTKEIFDIYKKQIGGVDCRGSSYSLLKLYTDLGFEAYTYSSGTPGDFTRVIVLVKTEYRGKAIILVEDPLYNVSYTTPQGEPLDFIKMIKLIKQKKYDQIVISDGNETYQYLCSSMDIKEGFCNPYLDGHTLDFHKGNIYGYKETPYRRTLLEKFDVYLENIDIVSGNKNKYPAYKLKEIIKYAIISK